MKVAIFGTGNMFEAYFEKIDWKSVRGVFDSNPLKQGKTANGYVIRNPLDLNQDDYDFVVVFTADYFYEVKEFLICELGVEERKIVSYMFYISNCNIWSAEAKQITVRFIKDARGSVLDTDTWGYSRYRTSLQSEKNIRNLQPLKYEYQDRYYTKEEQDDFAAILLWENFEKFISYQKIEEYMPDNLLWTVSHQYLSEPEFKGQLNWLCSSYEVSRYIFLDEAVFLCTKNREKMVLNCQIYQVCHKKYDCYRDEIYRTIRVGKGDFFNADYHDSTGDNIAELNDRINECTAIYWIWKNKKTDYVGINHYRRHFYNNNIKERANFLSAETIKTNLEDGETIIVPIGENIARAVGRDMYDKALFDVKRILKKVQIEYLDSFECVLKGNVMYRCNMLVTSWSIFNQYCQWLFSFLIDLARKVDVSCSTLQEKRVVGYFAEMMFTVWLNKQNWRLVEFPVSDV